MPETLISPAVTFGPENWTLTAGKTCESPPCMVNRNKYIVRGVVWVGWVD